MRLATLCLILVLPTDAIAQTTKAPNQLTDAERAAGWRLLFDGATLAGWRGIGASGVPEAHWAVEEGAIRKIPSGKVPVQADGQPLQGGDLITDATFSDFELSWEWRVAPGANSGIKYNVSEELSLQIPPKQAAIGFEYQVLDDDRHEDAAIPSHRAGSLYDLMAPGDNKRLSPVGEWNQSTVVLRDNHGEHWLNGVKILEFELGSSEMNAVLAASKYHTIEGFATRRAGHIVLQDHGDEVWFRAIKIRELNGAQR
jgi:hypothetical protein